MDKFHQTESLITTKAQRIVEPIVNEIEKIEEDIITENGPSPLPKVALHLPHRMNCFIQIWWLKFLATIVFTIHRKFWPPPPGHRPTLLKTYSCRPNLQNRVFFPPSYKPGDLLPLYLDIHGGGFALCDPQHDDEFCISWAKRTGMLVVSLNYRKAPLHPYPTAVYDVSEIAKAVLNDQSLPIDKSKVVIGGFSAGGNLALCAAQLPGLKGVVKAALTFYPIVDWSVPPEGKLAARPYKGGPRDHLEASSFWFDWAYVSVGQNRRDPLLSPCYAKKEDLPPWIFIVGAQWDMLRLEAQDMIHKLAGLEDEEDQEAAFEKGTYKWELAMNLPHGFTHQFRQKGEKKARREKRTEELYIEAHEWLKKGVLV